MTFHATRQGYREVNQSINQSVDQSTRSDSKYQKQPRQIWLIINLITCSIALIMIGITIFNPSLIHSISQPISQSVINQSIDQSFYHKSVHSESVEHIRENGVFLSIGTDRFGAVSEQSINQLSQHINQHGLVDGFSNTIILSVVNFGYIDFALNFLCFIERHNLTNFLIGAVDQETVDRFHLLGYGKHVISLPSLFNDSDLHWCGGIYTHAYRQACFNRQTLMKSKLVLTALLGGYTAVLSDMDIIFMHNPFLYLPMSHDWEMALEPHEFCTGFYINTPTAINIAMQSQVIAGMLNRPELDDQTIYNEWIHYHRTIAKQTMDNHLFPLSTDLFPNGQRFGVHSGIIQHNNWVQGADKKREKAKNLFLWLYNHNETEIKINEYLTSTSSAEIDEKHRFRNGSLLQCDRCKMCLMFVPHRPKLRETWPGPLLNTSFDWYRGELSKKHP